MNIALHDSDYTGFPNYALMKLSAYHKAQGDHVEWWIPMVNYDRVYSSKIPTSMSPLRVRSSFTTTRSLWLTTSKR